MRIGTGYTELGCWVGVRAGEIFSAADMLGLARHPWAAQYLPYLMLRGCCEQLALWAHCGHTARWPCVPDTACQGDLCLTISN